VLTAVAVSAAAALAALAPSGGAAERTVELGPRVVVRGLASPVGIAAPRNEPGRLYIVEQAGTPRDIYEQPATRFVAEFIGKANFIPLAGRADSDGTSVRVSLATEDGALVLVLPRTALREEAPRGGNGADGRSACLFIRPEKVAIGARGAVLGDDHVRLPARVAGRAYLGDRNEYLLAVGDGVELRVQAALGQDWAPGQAVDLSVGRADVLVYP